MWRGANSGLVKGTAKMKLEVQGISSAPLRHFMSTFLDYKGNNNLKDLSSNFSTVILKGVK